MRRLLCYLLGGHVDKGVEESAWIVQMFTDKKPHKVYYEWRCERCKRIREYTR